MSALNDLQEWFLFHCNDDWEQTNGVDIVSTDKPGWRLEVDLTGTELEDVKFKTYSYGDDGKSEDPDGNWIDCRVAGKRFVASGGPRKLEEMIDVFLVWAKANAARYADAAEEM